MGQASLEVPGSNPTTNHVHPSPFFFPDGEKEWRGVVCGGIGIIMGRSETDYFVHPTEV